MRAWLKAMLPVVGLLAHSPARAEAPSSHWLDHSALTLAPKRLEVGLFSQSAYAINDRVQISTHPLWFFALPQAHAKVRWATNGCLYFSTSHSLEYPWPFLRLVTKEGTGGLLPPTDPPPQSLLIENAGLLSARLAPGHWLTAELGFSVGPRTKTPVLLDFPFLYQRFAALNSAIVPHAAVSANGPVAGAFDYMVYSRYSRLFLPDTPGAFAWESEVELGWSVTPRVRVGASARGEVARFPVGLRWHWFPLADVRIAW